jgi:hypothetical protein
MSPTAENAIDFHAFFILASSHSAVKSSYATYNEDPITAIGSNTLRRIDWIRASTQIRVILSSINVPVG